jgi:hemolysin III
MPHALEEAPAEVVRQLRPKLRGWLHAAMAPLALVAGIVLVARAPTELGVVGGAVFLVASVLLFATSAVYHRFSWGPQADGVLRRLDHANIYLFIAATYTPLALMLLHDGSRVTLLTMVWTAAFGGLLFRTLWLSAPRWLYTSMYLLMGCSALGWIGAFYTAGGPAVVALILGGGVFYIAGAVVYGLQRPDPWPRWFGFHEIFHACTVGGFVCHYVAISLVTFSAS